MKRIQSLTILIFFILASFVSVYAKDEIYDLNYVLQLKGGFPYTIEDYAKEQGMTLEHFLYLENHSSYSIVEDDLKKIYEIRLKQIKPDSNTLMQKLVTKEVMEKYLNGEIKSPKGFISVCADLVHCRTIADFYYVLRMDYPHTKYNPDDEAIGIIRFKASNLDKCFIPFNKFILLIYFNYLSLLNILGNFNHCLLIYMQNVKLWQIIIVRMYIIKNIEHPIKAYILIFFNNSALLTLLDDL